MTLQLLKKSFLARRQRARAVATALRVFVPSWPNLPCLQWVFVLALLAAFAGRAHSDDGASETPLATKERIIHDRVLQLEDQMYRLIEQLRESEPDKARRMERVLARMGELGIRH